MPRDAAAPQRRSAAAPQCRSAAVPQRRSAAAPQRRSDTANMEILEAMPTKRNDPEAALLDQVLQLARLCGWRSFHARPARTAAGWRTAVQGDGDGFPDLLLLKGKRIVAAELKSGRGRLRPEQAAWLDAFRAAGVEAHVWTPADWPAIVELLRGGAGEDQAPGPFANRPCPARPTR